MSKETIITWNFPNWVTVVLMVSVGMIVVGAGLKFLAKGKAGNSEG